MLLQDQQQFEPAGIRQWQGRFLSTAEQYVCNKKKQEYSAVRSTHVQSSHWLFDGWL